ncbi:unnamed protein product [Rotaria socialis]
MSSTTSQKFRDFTSEPLKDKELNEVPGLGSKLASNLEQSGITKNKEYFELWIRDNAGANRHQAKQCAESIDAFCSQFL